MLITGYAVKERLILHHLPHLAMDMLNTATLHFLKSNLNIYLLHLYSKWSVMLCIIIYTLFHGLFRMVISYVYTYLSINVFECLLHTNSPSFQALCQLGSSTASTSVPFEVTTTFTGKRSLFFCKVASIAAAHLVSAGAWSVSML